MLLNSITYQGIQSTHLPPNAAYMSVNRVSISIDNRFLPIRHQAIIKTNAGLLSIHLSASSTLDVATSSLVIKVGHGGPMSHTSHTKDTRRGQLYCSIMVTKCGWFRNISQNKLILNKVGWNFLKEMISLNGFEGNWLQQVYCLEISRNNMVWWVGRWNK